MSKIEVSQEELQLLRAQSAAWQSIAAKQQELTRLTERFEEAHQKELSAKNQMKECQGELNSMIRDGVSGQLRLDFADEAEKTQATQPEVTTWRDWPIAKLGDTETKVSANLQKQLREAGVMNLGQLDKIVSGRAVGYEGGLSGILRQKRSQAKVEEALQELMPEPTGSSDPEDQQEDQSPEQSEERPQEQPEEQYEDVGDDEAVAEEPEDEEIDELAKSILDARGRAESEDPGEFPEATPALKVADVGEANEKSESNNLGVISVQLLKSIDRIQDPKISTKEGAILEAIQFANGAMFTLTNGDPCMLRPDEFRVIA